MKCKFCHREIKADALICTWCGRKQKDGKPVGVSTFTKTQEIIAVSVSKAKIVMKVIMGITLVGLFAIGAFYGWQWYQANSEKITATVSQQTGQLLTKLTGSAPNENAEQVATTAPKQDIGPLKGKSIELPVNIATKSDSSKYQLSVTRTTILDKQQSELHKIVLHLNLSIKVIPPAGEKAPLRIKIYRSHKPTGLAALVYDQVAEVKLQPGKIAKVPAMVRQLEQSIAKLATAPERIRKKYSAKYKKRYDMYRRRHPEWFENPKEQCSIFHYNKQTFTLRGNLTDIPPILIYFTVFLCKPDGTVIKALNTKQYAVTPPRTSKTQRYNRLAHAPSLKPLQGDAIYPEFNNRTRQLIFSFKQRTGFKITGFSIDGIKQIPTFTRRAQKKYIRRSGKRIQHYISKLSLNYPFGGLVKLNFKYLSAAGKVKRAVLDFFLPPPPPLLQLKYIDGKVKISWDDISSELNKKYFTKLPELELSKNRKLLKSITKPRENSYIDDAVSPGEPVSYTLILKNGICHAVRWSSISGIESFKVHIQQLINPFVPQSSDTLEGISMTIPSAKNRPHPVRIERLKNSICYENSGITAHKLLASVVNRVMQEQDMLFYDREARNYIMDEKYFALSPELRQQFLMKEADYAIQLKDYSRQSGNGVELWLFKKHIVGRNASKKTRYWRIADLSINSNEQDMAGAVNKLIAKIRQTLEFKTAPDNRPRTIKPANIICPPLRPVNEKIVIRNYEAVSETLFLALGEQSSTIKILSQSDWNKLFKERVRRFDKGHSVIDKMVREVLLYGRMWHTGTSKSYYIQACDAFTGELLGCRIFTGKIRHITAQLAKWTATFKLTNQIKADFHTSAFHYASARGRLLMPWRPKNDLLQNFGHSVKRSKKFRYIPRPKSTITKSPKNLDNFYDLVKRQWKDGFRAQAIQMLAADWQTKSTIKTGMLLSKYHLELKQYRAVLTLYDAMLEMDDCPIAIANNYNKVKKLLTRKNASSTKTKPHSPSTPRHLVKTTINEANGKTTISIGPPPGFWDKKSKDSDKGRAVTVVNGKKYIKYIPHTAIDKSAEMSKTYFIARDCIADEWAPGAPCQTKKIVQSFAGKTLFKGFKNPLAQKYGVPFKAYLRSFPYQHELTDFFDYRNLYNYYYTPPRFNEYIPHWDDPDSLHYTPPSRKQISQIQAVYKPTVIVLVRAWNSINPFSDKLDSQLSYTRLGYCFKLYGADKVKTFFELKAHPKLPMSTFTFFNPRDNRAYVSQIKTNVDMIRYFAYEALRKYYKEQKLGHKFTGQFYPLYQILAIDYMAQHGDSRAKKLYQKFMRITIPTTVKEYHKTRLNIKLLTFFAYKKRKKAIKLLSRVLNTGDYSLNSECKAEFLYLLAQAGLVSLSAKMAPHTTVADLRWAPKSFIDKFLVAYPDIYLVAGTKNRQVAKTYMLKPDAPITAQIVNQLFGKPPLEAYQDWRTEHFKRIKTVGKQ